MGKPIEIRTLGVIFPNYRNASTGWILDMRETSRNAKCAIEGFSSFQSVLVHDLGLLEPFSPASCPNETNILKPKQLNHQMAFCI